MTFYTHLSAQSQAIKDYRHGGGQDDNPYSKTTQRPQWDAYAWKMHELWHNDFKAEQRQLNQVINEENGNGKRNKSAKASRGIPGGSNDGSGSRPF